MQGIVTLLPERLSLKVRNIWKELEEKFGITGIKICPKPHFSWQIAGDYDFEKLEKVLQELSEEANPFSVETSGLGIFTGDNPVLFLNIIKTSELINFHSVLWEKTVDKATDINEYYSPEKWTPHISLAFDDLNDDNLGLIIQELAFRDFNWDFQVDNLSVICEIFNKIGDMKYEFRFKNQGNS